MGLYEGLYERTVLAFRPSVEVIDLTGGNLEIEEFERLDAAANLLIERIQKLELDRAAAGDDGTILERIRKEYDQKLREAERRLKAKRKALTRKLRDMEEGKATLERRRDDVRAEIKECEVRRRIGEYQDPLFEMLVNDKTSDLDFIGRKVVVLERNVDFYRRALAKEKDAFPCAACGALNPIWDVRCQECGAEIQPSERAPEPPAALLVAPEDGRAAETRIPLPVSPPAEELMQMQTSLDRTLVRDLASIDLAAEDLPPSGPSPNGRPYLLRIQGPNTGERYDLDGGEIGIGKAGDNQVSIPDDRALSRRHAKIVFEGGRPILYDLGSTNGTAVNGRAVEVSPIEHDDEIAMGSSIYRYSA